MSENRIKIIECPRDAMQGLKEFIPTEVKAAYINQLLKVGFDTLDMGSFVSPKAIPQLRDTGDVIKKLDLNDTISKLLVIVANKRGAEAAAAYDEIKYLGFPFSISATFQKRNINSTIEESLSRLEAVSETAYKHNKEVVTYFSMAFGNPYDDPWNAEIVAEWAHRLVEEYGVKILSMSDTIGSSSPETIKWIFSHLIPKFPDVEIGAHLHTTPDKWEEKIHASIQNNCKRFDSAIKGYGGCPMAKDDLTGNMPTEHLIEYLNQNNLSHGLDEEEFARSMHMALKIFPH
ncbi:hydroxymethylglutaryl-CoA lyase [Parvicella tangerina]|uniref:Hydroxymethylglutaryl-CoA lyase YngG n=1 Tax=Parvicella tangerina TaxID=2829795 RepID=A0A916JKI1_9FLAO|nr:hydroxymethylglutaryl-CoA lyase [Parvicella tangerina]CAG5078308.1 Hydroxymethylglutaryl-CoA lyase YngG [Parvicella tangerina]